MPNAGGWGRGRWIHGVFLGLWVSGCSGSQVRNSLSHDKDVPGRDQRLLSVPFFPDNTDQCGPSALASVLAYWGPPIDPPALKGEIYLAHLRGSLAMDLMLAAEKRGFKARLYNGSIDDAKSELRKGHPLVAFVNRGFDFFPIGHYVVICGYDDARRGLYIHSGLAKKQFVDYASFSKEWDKTQRSTLLVLPPALDRDNETARGKT